MTTTIDSSATTGRAGSTMRRPGGRWWSIQDIAADLGVSLNTAYKWSSRGQPDFPRTVRLRNGAVRVRDDWYEEWLTRLEK
ncbi:MAG: helix-turn-helix transcriptional regulator [Acidimicrobiales bacterium]